MSYDFSKHPLTLDDLNKLLEEKFPVQLKKSVLSTQENAIWFLCFLEARLIMHACRLKDVAWLFREGVAPMEKRVEEMLAGFWEEYLEEVDGKRTWRQDLGRESIKDLKSRYKRLIEDITEHFKDRGIV